MDDTVVMKSETNNTTAGERQPYIPPQMEVIQMEVEGSVMTPSDFGGGNPFGPWSHTITTNEPGDLINDVLTFEG